MPPARSVSNKSQQAKKQPLTLAQLASYDDILTDALVDHVSRFSDPPPALRWFRPAQTGADGNKTYYWTTIPKNRPSYHASRGFTEEEITKIIQTHLVVEPNLDVAEAKLLATSGLKKFYNGLKTDKEKLDLKRHLRRYMQIYLPDCPFEVSSTNRYTIFTHEASITARRYIKKNETIKYLCGIQVVITPEEEAELSKRKKDFSIVVSSRNKCANLFMGPARFANHDCNANARLKTTEQAGIEIIATKNIDVGDEITVTYGESYFGEDNCECLCQSCEDNLVNGWAQGEVSAPVQRSIEEDVFGAAQGYSLRRRRRDDSTLRAHSETRSVTPDIRPRVRKSRASHLGSLGDGASPAAVLPVLERAPGSLLQKRKRAAAGLATPPSTPAKRQKTVQHDVVPIPMSASSRASSVDGLSRSVSSVDSGGHSTATNVTTPDEDTPGPVIHSPKPTPIRAAISVLEHQHEDSLRRSAEGMTPSSSPSEKIGEVDSEGAAPIGSEAPDSDGIPVQEAAQVQGTTTGDTELERALSLIDPQRQQLTRQFASETTAIPNPEALGAADSEAVPQSSAALASASTLPSVIDSVEQMEPTRLPSGLVQHHGDSQDSLVRHPSQSESERDTPLLDAHSETDQPPAAPAKKTRVPGDYTLTPVLLSEPETAWIHCTICNIAFVQRDAYYTRSACPRCERHSKLYGYIWPKTEREGQRDTEERVLDHRTVHRFLDADDEARIRGRKLPPKMLTTPAASENPSTRRDASQGLLKKTASRKRTSKAVDDDSDAEPDMDVEAALMGLRRSGRARKSTAKAVRSS